MPSLFKELQNGGTFVGGRLRSYPLNVLYEEIAFLAYYFHWSHEEIMLLDHKDRIRYCQEASKINKKMNGEPKNIFDI